MLKPGTQVGAYTVVDVIAAGGMAVVYRARRRQDGELVALKVLLSNLAMSERTRTRFAQGAWIQGQLDHPNILQVFPDFVLEEQHTAFAMQLVDGPSLADLLGPESGREPWSLDRAMELIVPVLKGVAHAHRRSVVHRDLKPGNILLPRTDNQPDLAHPLIVDFDLARLTESDSNAVRTREGSMLGTPPYMAPEQFRGDRDIGRSADVHAIGMMCWELLVGRLPVPADDMLAAAELYTGRTPLPRLDALQRAPTAVAEVVARSLASHRDHRFDSAGEMLTHLHQALADTGPAPFSLPPASIVPTQLPPEPSSAHDAPGRPATSATPTSVPPASAPPPSTAPPPQEPLRAAESSPPPAKEAVSAPLPVPPAQSRPGVSRGAAVGVGLAAMVGVAAAVAVWMKPSPESTATSPASSATAIPAGMIRVEARSVQIGCPADDSACSNARPTQTVSVSAFLMDRTEVTAGDYARCVSDGACGPVSIPDNPRVAVLCNADDRTRQNHPANCLTYTDAMAYCASVQKRLPTEDEWEAAARAEPGAFPWGDNPPDCSRAVYNPKEGTLAGLGCETGRTWPVGSLSKGATRTGIVDLSGNVAEWVNADPTGLAADKRVAKGGDFVRGVAALHPGSRAFEHPLAFHIPSNAVSFGVRCARDP